MIKKIRTTCIIFCSILIIFCSTTLLLFCLMNNKKINYYLSSNSYRISNVNYKKETIKVMSFNILCHPSDNEEEHSWFDRSKYVIDDIRKTSPDIICFQEVTKLQYQYLKYNLRGYSSINCYRDESKVSESVPIFYRKDRFSIINENTFWLSKTPNKISILEDAKYHRICTYGIFEDKKQNNRFVVMNTHFDIASQNVKKEEMNILYEQMIIRELNKYPLILAGDFNTKIESMVFTDILKSFDDVKSIVKEKNNYIKYTTFHNFGINNNSIIDLCLLSKDDWIALDYEVVLKEDNEEYSSDHYPIVISLKYK